MLSATNSMLVYNLLHALGYLGVPLATYLLKTTVSGSIVEHSSSIMLREILLDVLVPLLEPSL